VVVVSRRPLSGQMLCVYFVRQLNASAICDVFTMLRCGHSELDQSQRPEANLRIHSKELFQKKIIKQYLLLWYCHAVGACIAVYFVVNCVRKMNRFIHGPRHFLEGNIEPLNIEHAPQAPCSNYSSVEVTRWTCDLKRNQCVQNMIL